MIKHRFILRGEDDFRIFAAIPVEQTVLKWEKHVPVLELDAVLGLVDRVFTAESEHHAALLTLNKAIKACLSFVLSSLAGRNLADPQDPDPSAIISKPLASYAESVAAMVTLSRDDVSRTAEFLAALPAMTPASAVQQLESRLTHERVFGGPEAQLYAGTLLYSAIVHVAATVGEALKGHKMTSTGVEFIGHLRILSAAATQAVETSKHITCGAEIEKLFATAANAVCCPEGVPFAAYTVEFHSAVVDIVEGCAWLHEKPEDELKHELNQEIEKMLTKEPEKARARIRERLKLKLNDTPSAQSRALTEDEKRVVEIVSQMLTERSLNPKADTRIPVVSIDPKHEHDVRAAEDKDAKSPPTGTRLRTIKFTVSPPRYLRAAAERILASPRKAHWVVGHWRDQAYGTAHQLRRQTWIKPHIRGLGEAGAITAKIAAPDEQVAAAPVGVKE